MVAILAVLAHSVSGWPRGGFVGIDIFFVVAGYFVTESLLRTSADTGRPSLGTFYLDRLRRIVPAATLVLILTFAATIFVLPPPGAHDTGVDALFAFFFVANWHFAADGVSVLAATDTASPLLHFWPLSVEEQFFLVWPVMILGITVIALRAAWSHTRWLAIAASVMGVVVVASLGWALYETAASPGWAYLNTFGRVWEFGVGALLATAVGVLARTPDLLRPVLSWLGLVLIGLSLIIIDGSSGFPAPWAVLPVAGAALVIAAGVGREPDYQWPLRNQVSTYLGDLSYSLYLVHWPVIVLLAAMMKPDAYYYASVATLTVGLAVLLHHLVENPLRYASMSAVRQARADMRHGLYHAQLSTKIAAVAGLIMLTFSVISYAMSADAIEGPRDSTIVTP